jgi:sarcosine oxidase subunit gamma
VTGEAHGLRRFRTRLGTIDATETLVSQIDVRVDASATDRLSLPVVPNTWIGSDGREVLWLGPDEWLVVGPAGAEHALIEKAERALARVHHSVVDVSSARAVFDLASEDRHELLSKGSGLDLHPRSWRDGMCAQTLLARVPVILQEREGATRVFVRPSFAGYLVDWLLDAAGVRA